MALASPEGSEIRFGKEEQQPEDGDEDELSDEQMAALLQEASTRLQQKASAKAAAADIDLLDPDSIRYVSLIPSTDLP